MVKLLTKMILFDGKIQGMAKTPLWQLIQNNRLLQPFQVRDISGRTLIDRARFLILIVVIAVVFLFLLSSHQVNMLINRDELERQENEFITQFYPAYDSLYFWLNYQGNLAEKLAQTTISEAASERFLAELMPDLQKMTDLKYIQFGQVGVNSQWVAVPADEEWQLSSEVNQDFAAWLLTQDLQSDQIYWFNGRPESDELGLFWLYIDENGEKVYFLAVMKFDYQLAFDQVTGLKKSGLVVFASRRGEQQIFPLELDEHKNATSTAKIKPEGRSKRMLNSVAVWEEFVNDKVWQDFEEKGQTIFDFKWQGDSFWVKISPAVTRTDYQVMAIILPETELLGAFGIRSLWIQWVMIFLIIGSFLMFLYYYARYSRRYYFTNQVKDIIKNGENARLEFKSSLRYDLKEKQLNKSLEGAILKSIAAFNNTDGGLLIIGVSDDARVLGLRGDYSTLKKADKDGFELHLRALISQAYGEHFAARRIEIFFPVLENKEVCVVKVKKGRSALYTNMSDKNGVKQEKFYIRLGNSSREIEKLSDIVDYQNQRFKLHMPKWGKK